MLDMHEGKHYWKKLKTSFPDIIQTKIQQDFPDWVSASSSRNVNL